MSLSWLTQAKELLGQLPILTGAAARCGDFVYNLSGGSRSINELPILLRTIAPDTLGAAIDSLSPYLTQTSLSDAACAIESKTGLPAPATCALVTGGVYLGAKCLQFGYRKFNAKTPVELIQEILVKNVTSIMNMDYAKVAKTIDSVVDLKVDAMLNDLQTKYGAAFAKMTPKAVNEYKEEARKQTIETLPTQLKAHEEEVRAAVTQSQVPMPAADSVQKTAAPGTQEGVSLAAAFDLKNVLANILFGLQAAPAATATVTNRM